MFSARVEKQIMEAVNQETTLNITEYEVHQMRIVPDVGKGRGKTILTLQKGITTLLVSVRISDDGQKLIIIGIKTVTW